MGYLDDLSSLFSRSGIDDDIEADAVVVDDSPLGKARSQFEDARPCYHEGPEGTFRASGSVAWCGYAEACVTVDPESGLASVDVDAGLRLSPDKIPAARKLFHAVNQTLNVAGLCVDEQGYVHFRPEVPCDLNAGGDVADWVDKGFSTIRANAEAIVQLEAGVPVWEVARLRSEQERKMAFEAFSHFMADGD